MPETGLPEKGRDRPDADAFGRALPAGIGINLLVTDVTRAAAFQQAVLGARVVYLDDDFAIVAAGGTSWMLHHDRTYRANPLSGIALGADGRGAGVELRIYGRDPDAAVSVAENTGCVVLAGAADKPHGLREAYILDDDGYCWVPCCPSAKAG
ncbi:MAG: hypothetical protein AAF334_09750 [Pseudomonadota bacterium]